jgi:hypothetical protein
LKPTPWGPHGRDVRGPKNGSRLSHVGGAAQLYVILATRYHKGVAVKAKLALLFAVLLVVTQQIHSQKSIAEVVLSYARGERYRYSSKGHEKSMGMQIQLQIPNGWKQKEGERPHIIQKFSGSGRLLGIAYVCILQANELPMELQTFSETEISDALFSPEQTEESLPSGMKMTISKRTQYDGQPGQVFAYTGQAERAGATVITSGVVQRFIYKRKLITVTVTYGLVPVTGVKYQMKEIEDDVTRLPALAQLIGNSIVLMDMYE